jgi:hypothetical protein
MSSLESFNRRYTGQFSFSEQDLVLPVNGIPITVTRTYNSLNPPWFPRMHETENR